MQSTRSASFASINKLSRHKKNCTLIILNYLNVLICLPALTRGWFTSILVGGVAPFDFWQGIRKDGCSFWVWKRNWTLKCLKPAIFYGKQGAITVVVERFPMLQKSLGKWHVNTFLGSEFMGSVIHFGSNWIKHETHFLILVILRARQEGCSEHVHWLETCD